MFYYFFLFYAILPSQRYSTLFVIFAMFFFLPISKRDKKNLYKYIYILFFCATFHHCVQYRMCQWWQYMYIN